MSDIGKVGVVGAGLMGSGIAEVCARAGLDVFVREDDDEALTAGFARIGSSLDRGLAAGKLTEDERSAALSRLSFTVSVDDLADCDLVIEAATENPGVKFALFAELDQVVKRPDAILATNTSTRG
jgi:3-hydroxybutyryl-CoA dehydrogenase